MLDENECRGTRQAVYGVRRPDERPYASGSTRGQGGKAASRRLPLDLERGKKGARNNQHRDAKESPHSRGGSRVKIFIPRSLAPAFSPVYFPLPPAAAAVIAATKKNQNEQDND